MVRYMQGLRGLGAAVWFYLAAVGLVGFGFDGGIYAVLLNLFLVRMGYGPEQVGLVNSVGTFTFALSSLPAGFLGERFGTRRMLLLGFWMMLIGSALVPLADALPVVWQLPWLIVHMVGLYMGLALFFVNTAPYLLDLVGAAQRTQVFSLQTGLLSLAAFAGSLTGGLLPPAFADMLGVTLDVPAPYRYALLAGALALIPALLAIAASRPGAPAHAHEERVSPGAQAGAEDRPIWGFLLLLALVRMLQVGGLATVSTFMNVYLDRGLLVPTAQIGAILAMGRLLAVPAALSTSALTDRFGQRNVIFWVSVGTAVAMLPIALIPHWVAAAVSMLCVVSLSWIRYAASTIFFMELVPPSRRSLVSGATEMAAGVTFTLVAIGGGYLIGWAGYQPLFLTAAGIALLSAVVFWAGFGRRR